MPATKFSEPIEDSVSKVDDAIAVGEDLNFQRRWWRFERAIWVAFALILVARHARRLVESGAPRA